MLKHYFFLHSLFRKIFLISNFSQIQVNVLDMSKSEVKVLQMEQHTKCHSSCDNEPDSCKKNQKFVPKTCSCECITKSSCPSRQYWNPTDCDCKCKVKTPFCGSLKMWDESTCSCQCKRTPKLESCTNMIDSQTCRCVSGKTGFPYTSLIKAKRNLIKDEIL